MTGDDVLVEACDILEGAGIDYWVCHGTLLGIIRESRLLPWDHDIDLAVWYDDYCSDKIKRLFLAKSYLLEEIDPMNQCLHFIKSGSTFKLDINFYRQEGDQSVVRWLVRKPGLLSAVRYKIFEGLTGSSFRYSSNNLFGLTFAYFTWGIGKMLLFSLPSGVATVVKDALSTNLLKFIGYAYPNELMETADFNYKSRLIRVPKHYEKVLELTYGKDWVIPKQSYTWHVEAKNLK